MIHCFYHSADLDGHCSGAIVKYRFPEAIMHPINYGNPFPWNEIAPEDTVYMVDFCLQPFSEMAKLCGMLKYHYLRWIDHHSSADDAFFGYTATNSYLQIARTFRTDRAACELTWEYLFPDKPMPLAVYLLGRYDVWDHSDERVLPFQMRMRMEQLDPKDWDKCFGWWDQLFMTDPKIAGYWLNQLIDEGKFLLRYDEEQKRKYVQTYGFETDLDIPGRLLGTEWPIVTKLSCIAVNLGHTNSKVFDSVWRKMCVCEGKADSRDPYACTVCRGLGYIEPYDLMITFCRRKDRKWNVSLYSTKPDIDCGAICKSFGGGGHKGAADFQCDELPFEY